MNDEYRITRGLTRRTIERLHQADVDVLLTFNSGSSGETYLVESEVRSFLRGPTAWTARQMGVSRRFLELYEANDSWEVRRTWPRRRIVDVIDDRAVVGSEYGNPEGLVRVALACGHDALSSDDSRQKTVRCGQCHVGEHGAP